MMHSYDFLTANKKKIWKEVFFEEYEIISSIIDKLDDNFTVLDLGCGNCRFKVLVDDICVKHDKKCQRYTWVDNQEFEGQYCKNFVLEDVNTYLYSLNRADNNDDKHDLIILSWMFDNNIKFSKKIISKLFSLLSTRWTLYLSFWNYENTKWDKLYRSEDQGKLSKYGKSKITSVLEALNKKCKILYYKKSRNSGYNIVVTVQN